MLLAFAALKQNREFVFSLNSQAKIRLMELAYRTHTALSYDQTTEFSSFIRIDHRSMLAGINWSGKYTLGIIFIIVCAILWAGLVNYFFSRLLML